MQNTRPLLAGIACLLALFFSASVRPVGAQQQAPELDAIRTPPTPAFTVLDIEPSAVERPATPTDTAVAIVNKFRDGTVPKNFAFESSPYWLVSRPHVTWRDDDKRTVRESLARTTSVSIATAETGTAAAPVSSLAFGIRAQLLSGSLSKATSDAYKALEERLGQNGSLFLSMMFDQGLGTLDAQLLDCTLPRPPAPPATDEARKKCLAEYETKKSALTTAVLKSEAFKKASAPLTGGENIVPKREGVFLEVAAAFAYDYAKAEWKAQQFRKGSVWVTPSYTGGPWSAIGVFRYDRAHADGESAIDWGARVMNSTTNYAFSLEFVERTPIDSATLKRSHRLIGIGEYRVTDGAWVVASFGKDRQKTTNQAETLVAQLGLSFNFSKERYKFPATP